MKYSRLNSPLSILMITMMISACATTKIKPWPENVPPKATFVQTYQEQKENGTNSNSLKDHLVWIKRFYLGTALYPTGWNRMTGRLLSTVNDPDEYTLIEKKMYDLGLRICIEWAQDNASRKINSSAIVIWGNALRDASEKGRTLALINRVENDVDALLNETLLLSEITNDRYFKSEDYDDF